MQWLRSNALPGEPGFGQTVPCPECYEPELKAKRQAELTRLSGMENFVGKTFQTFDTKIPGVAQAFQAAREYAANMQGWLLLKGGFGCGKTHLAAAIANEVKQGLYFAVVPDLLDYLRSAFNPDREGSSYGDRFEMVKNVNLLILDDLGTENQTVWVRQAMFQLINHRYNHRLPTVITTNDYTRSEERVIDRMFDQRLVKLVVIEADSYRLKAR